MLFRSVLLADLFGTSAETIDGWVRTHRYVSGPEMVAAGLAEMISLRPLEGLVSERR